MPGHTATNMDFTPEKLTDEAFELLEHLVRIPSVSREEAAAADFLEAWLRRRGLSPQRHGNNLWLLPPALREDRPTLLLNAHIDTVKPSDGWTRPPFEPTREGDRLYGLGTNDCGGGLVTLLQAWRALTARKDLPYNLIYLASAEEEVSGRGGVESVLDKLPEIDVALVGEPTGLEPAVAEKGLMVLDCTAHGRSGHAARREGVNALYEALPDIHWFRTKAFERVSPLLGEVVMSVTMISAGRQHNVVPDKCQFTVDVRPNECNTNEELLAEIRRAVRCDVVPRSTRLRSSSIDTSHPLIARLCAMGRTPFGSPTLSDQALMPFPSFKLGPGQSSRSHTADEYICRSELEAAMRLYTELLA